MRTLHNIRVAGVTYEGRQSYLEILMGDEPVRLVPEPENPYDANAIAVHIATADGVKHCGYIPRELAAEITPAMEGESFDCSIEQITGGFDIGNGETATLGLRLKVQLPDAEDTVK